MNKTYISLLFLLSFASFANERLSEQELLQNDVIFTCEDIARSSLTNPDSYEREQTESGVDDQGNKKVYYFTLHYSGVNSFNVRDIHTVECYGTIGDAKHDVTYKMFR
ncbi:hypothetical protein [Phytobacter diazotrophicus]|uniref:hypothetical protein n=1 Tax=Phytobacter diazotrophicus TaxID=395631 RepID=UPI00307685AD